MYFSQDSPGIISCSEYLFYLLHQGQESRAISAPLNSDDISTFTDRINQKARSHTIACRLIRTQSYDMSRSAYTSSNNFFRIFTVLYKILLCFYMRTHIIPPHTCRFMPNVRRWYCHQMSCAFICSTEKKENLKEGFSACLVGHCSTPFSKLQFIEIVKTLMLLWTTAFCCFNHSFPSSMQVSSN